MVSHAKVHSSWHTLTKNVKSRRGINDQHCNHQCRWKFCICPSPPHYYKYRKLCLLNGRKRIRLLIWSRGEFTGSQRGTLSKEEEFERKSPENRPSVPDAAAAAQPSNSMRLRCVHRPASRTSSPGEWRVGKLTPSSSDSASARFQPD